MSTMFRYLYSDATDKSVISTIRIQQQKLLSAVDDGDSQVKQFKSTQKRLASTITILSSDNTSEGRETLFDGIQ